ncbi:MAG: hypothetical protein F6K62_14065 [Sphaerospermopsis sp. SIO1G2]|nr:hypothetical protein [Sphaerospermopsis sp. SIO1G2]
MWQKKLDFVDPANHKSEEFISKLFISVLSGENVKAIPIELMRNISHILESMALVP